jgi:hypothetical protein
VEAPASRLVLDDSVDGSGVAAGNSVSRGQPAQIASSNSSQPTSTSTPARLHAPAAATPPVRTEERSAPNSPSNSTCQRPRSMPPHHHEPRLSYQAWPMRGRGDGDSAGSADRSVSTAVRMSSAAEVLDSFRQAEALYVDLSRSGSSTLTDPLIVRQSVGVQRRPIRVNPTLEEVAARRDGPSLQERYALDSGLFPAGVTLGRVRPLDAVVSRFLTCSGRADATGCRDRRHRRLRAGRHRRRDHRGPRPGP